MSGDIKAVTLQVQACHLDQPAETGTVTGTPKDDGGNGFIPSSDLGEGKERSSHDDVVCFALRSGCFNKVMRVGPDKFLELLRGAFGCDDLSKVRQHLSPEDEAVLLRK
ncbi:hypothetical protein BHE90_017650, partial [Fusarium euwallaceae]